VNAPTDAELDPLAGELGGDVVQVPCRATEPVQLGHHQDIPVADRTQRRGEPRPLPVTSGPAPIGVQMLVGDPELFQGSELRTHILARGGASGVPNEDFGHQQSLVLIKPALPDSLPRRSTRTAHAGRSRPPKGCGTVLYSDRQTGQRQTRASEEEPPSRPQPGDYGGWGGSLAGMSTMVCMSREALCEDHAGPSWVSMEGTEGVSEWCGPGPGP